MANYQVMFIILLSALIYLSHVPPFFLIPFIKIYKGTQYAEER